MLYRSILEQDNTTQEHFLVLNGGDRFKYKFSLEHYLPMSQAKLKKLEPIFKAALDCYTAKKIIEILSIMFKSGNYTLTQCKRLKANIQYFDKYTN